MSSFECRRSTLIIIALFLPSNCIRCDRNASVDEENKYECTSDAIDSLFKAMIDHDVPLEFRCERYPILLSRAEITTGPILVKTVKQLTNPSRNFLNENLRHIDMQKYISLVMAAIDRYRTTKLGPGFIDLIDCLKRIDRPEIKQYLCDDELSLIEDLYRQVLATPNIRFNLDGWKWPRFHIRFMLTLRQLFKDNIPENQGRESEGELGSGDKYRERDRLRKRRRRILGPEETRERDRIYKRNRRQKSLMERRPLRPACDQGRNLLRPTNRGRLPRPLQRHSAQQPLNGGVDSQVLSGRLMQQLPDLNRPPPDVESAPKQLDHASARQQLQQTSTVPHPSGKVFSPLFEPANITGLPQAHPEQTRQAYTQLPLASMEQHLPYFSQIFDSHACSLPGECSFHRNVHEDWPQRATPENSS